MVSYKLYVEYVDLGTLPTSPSSEQPQEVLGAKTENAGSGHDTKKYEKRPIHKCDKASTDCVRRTNTTGSCDLASYRV